MLVYQRVVLVGKIAICTPYTCMIPEQTYVFVFFLFVQVMIGPEIKAGLNLRVSPKQLAYKIWDDFFWGDKIVQPLTPGFQEWPEPHPLCDGCCCTRA